MIKGLAVAFLCQHEASSFSGEKTELWIHLELVLHFLILPAVLEHVASSHAPLTLLLAGDGGFLSSPHCLGWACAGLSVLLSTLLPHLCVFWPLSRQQGRSVLYTKLIGGPCHSLREGLRVLGKSDRRW